MKKLMIAAAIVCAAVMSHAAQYNWSTTDVADGYNDGMNCAAGMAYLFYSGSTDYTIAAIQAAVAGGTFVKDGYANLALASSTVDKAGAFGGLTAEGLAGATGDSFYAVIVADHTWEYETGTDLGKVDPVQAYMTAGFTPGAVEDKGQTNLLFGDAGSLYSATSGNVWTAQTVPEPTSGLLLLLGVAGMALRRRRA